MTPGLNVTSKMKPITIATTKKNSVSEVVRGKSNARMTRLTAVMPRKISATSTAPRARRLIARSSQQVHRDRRPDRREENRIQQDDLRVRHQVDAARRQPPVFPQASGVFPPPVLVFWAGFEGSAGRGSSGMHCSLWDWTRGGSSLASFENVSGAK